MVGYITRRLCIYQYLGTLNNYLQPVLYHCHPILTINIIIEIGSRKLLPKLVVAKLLPKLLNVMGIVLSERLFPKIGNDQIVISIGNGTVIT